MDYSKSWVIAVDAMGGDNAPYSVVAGLDIAYSVLVKHNVSILLFGDSLKLAPLLVKFPNVNAISKVIHSSEVVAGDDKPSHIIRRGRNTSMWKAIESVRNKEADAVVSAGNTGCLMGLSKLLISTIEGIKRPAITSLLPSQNGLTAMLDLGANTECDEQNLVQFAMMGSVFVKTLLNKTNPTVGILNIGTEAGKGLTYLNNTDTLFKESKNKYPFEYKGFVEGTDIFKSKVDVIVTDGFSGNIALKTIEGTVNFIKSEIKHVIKKSLLAIVGYLFMLPAVRKFKAKMDTKKHNGAILLGINGLVVKSHGNADAVSFANAVIYASNLLSKNFISEMTEIITKNNM